MNRKNLYVLIGIIFFISGAAGAFISLKIAAFTVAGMILLAAIILDFEKATYLVALYSIIDYALRKAISISILSSTWDELFFVFCMLVWFYKWLACRKQKAYRWTPLEFPLMFFFGVSMFLLLINTPDIKVGIEGLRAVIQYIFWFFAIVQLVRTPSGSRRLIYVLLAAGFYIALEGVYQYIIGAEMPANWVDRLEQPVRTRAFSIIGSPNILGSLMVLLIPVTVSLVYFEEKPLKKAMFMSIALTMAACLLFTLSRGAWIGFVAAVGIYALMKDKRLIIPLALSIVFVMLFVPSVSNRITYMLSPEYIASSLKGGRLARWGTGLELVKQNLWFGVGLGRFGGAVAINNRIPGTFYMDNYYLKTLVEMGLVGFSAYCLLIYNAVVWVFRTIQNLKGTRYMHIAQGIFAGICGVLVHCAFENVFEYPMMTVYFWLLIGVVMYLRYVNKERLLEADKNS